MINSGFELSFCFKEAYAGKVEGVIMSSDKLINIIIKFFIKIL